MSLVTRFCRGRYYLPHLPLGRYLPRCSLRELPLGLFPIYSLNRIERESQKIFARALSLILRAKAQFFRSAHQNQNGGADQ
jgi:hypothetical protein